MLVQVERLARLALPAATTAPAQSAKALGDTCSRVAWPAVDPVLGLIKLRALLARPLAAALVFLLLCNSPLTFTFLMRRRKTDATRIDRRRGVAFFCCAAAFQDSGRGSSSRSSRFCCL